MLNIDSSLRSLKIWGEEKKGSPLLRLDFASKSGHHTTEPHLHFGSNFTGRTGDEAAEIVGEVIRSVGVNIPTLEPFEIPKIEPLKPLDLNLDRFKPLEIEPKPWEPSLNRVTEFERETMARASVKHETYEYKPLKSFETPDLLKTVPETLSSISHEPLLESSSLPNLSGSILSDPGPGLSLLHRSPSLLSTVTEASILEPMKDHGWSQCPAPGALSSPSYDPPGVTSGYGDPSLAYGPPASPLSVGSWNDPTCWSTPTWAPNPSLGGAAFGTPLAASPGPSGL